MAKRKKKKCQLWTKCGCTRIISLPGIVKFPKKIHASTGDIGGPIFSPDKNPFYNSFRTFECSSITMSYGDDTKVRIYREV